MPKHALFSLKNRRELGPDPLWPPSWPRACSVLY